MLTFDEVFKIWMDAVVGKVEGRDLLPVAKQKGFNSVTEWRLNTALRLGMDTKQWRMETISNPNTVLPNVIIGPYQGWSKFFENQLATTFAQALEIPEFFQWCKTHDRVQPLAANFPLPSSLIFFQKPSGEFIHIEGGHRICAVAYRVKTGHPVNFFDKPPITAAIAPASNEDIENMKEFLKRGTFKRPHTT